MSDTEWHVSPIGGTVRKGRWRLAPKTLTVALIGGARLDLSEADIPAAGATYTHVALIGGISATVPAGVRVRAEGFSLIGGRSVELDETSPDAPTVRLRVFSLIGGISADPR